MNVSEAGSAGACWLCATAPVGVLCRGMVLIVAMPPASVSLSVRRVFVFLALQGLHPAWRAVLRYSKLLQSQIFYVDIEGRVKIGAWEVAIVTEKAR